MATSNIKVLLLDDDVGDQLILRATLSAVRDVAYEVDCAATADQAIQYLLDREHDVCLVDYWLGCGTGLDFMARLRQIGIHIPVILLTGYQSRQVDMAATEQGACDYLIKGRLGSELLERAIRYAISRRRMEDEMRRLALYDDLTGLPNRRLFDERFERAAERARRGGTQVGVIYVDLNGFKPINDSRGHQAGDAVLVVAGRRIAECLRKVDTVARLGGDEFVAVLEDLECQSEALTVARRIAWEIARPIVLGDGPVRVTASIGVAFFPDGAIDLAEVLRRADCAMYRAKQRSLTGNDGAVEVYDGPAALREAS